MHFRRMTIAVLLVSSIFLFSSSIQPATAQPTTGSSQNCACPDKSEPVCASGKQFKNACFAECAGVTSHSPCTPQQQQQQQQQPPAAAAAPPKPQAAPKPNGGSGSGQNAGSASSAAPACACPREFNPVCGIDGAFFPNKCLAKCVGTQVSDKPPKDGKCSHIKEQRQQQQQQQQQQQKPAGPAPTAAATGGSSSSSSSKDCGCPKDVTVVCGKLDGKESNYANACTAKCLGAQVLYNTPCKSSGSSSSSTGAPAAAAPQQQQAASGTMQNGGAVSQSQPQAEPIQLPPLEHFMEPATKCGCPRLKVRVCAMVYNDYVTVVNSCTARCYGLPIAHLGKCHDHDLARNQLYTADLGRKHRKDDQKGGCVCPMIYSPVCANGQTFSNACVARCNGYPLASATNCLLGL